MIKKELCSFVLHDILGWESNGTFPENEKKMIVITAPHTSMMDFIIGYLYFGSQNKKAYFAIRQEFFFFPLGYLLKAMGSIPVARGKTALIDKMVEEFNQREYMILNITPEGTRKLTKNWKKGFHYIAKKANVPLVLGFFDYKNKKCGLMDPAVFPLSDNASEDLEKIKKRYDFTSARHPKQFTNK
jgi:1-acyl-sn-glycerol-3-phosphate acyltransferase